jgi:hypothetical protein
MLDYNAEIASGRNKSVPWELVFQTPDDFIDPEYMPAGIFLKDPSKLHRDDTKKILEHWKDRQDDADVETTFMFRAFVNKEKEVVENIGQQKSVQVTQRTKKTTPGSQNKKGKAKRATRAPIDNRPDREETPLPGDGDKNAEESEPEGSDPEESEPEESEPEDEERGHVRCHLQGVSVKLLITVLNDRVLPEELFPNPADSLMNQSQGLSGQGNPILGQSQHIGELECPIPLRTKMSPHRTDIGMNPRPGLTA